MRAEALGRGTAWRWSPPPWRLAWPTQVGLGEGVEEEEGVGPSRNSPQGRSHLKEA